MDYLRKIDAVRLQIVFVGVIRRPTNPRLTLSAKLDLNSVGEFAKNAIEISLKTGPSTSLGYRAKPKRICKAP
jgi:hypothetical protein